jgi:protocatechuate 3,4-dioxygenase beta subunit
MRIQHESADGGVARKTRREFLGRISLAVPAAILGPPPLVSAQSGTLPLTPACTESMEVTPTQTEGPYFKPNSPARASLLETGVAGTRLLISGWVLTRGCKPVPRALLDFWQADDRGEYDNRGYRLRGHQFTDEAGRWQLETVVPGPYPGRTRHIHVKVQSPGGPVLTTQLYFPGDSRNSRDGLFRQDLQLKIQDADGGKAARFDFVLDERPGRG